ITIDLPLLHTTRLRIATEVRCKGTYIRVSGDARHPEVALVRALQLAHDRYYDARPRVHVASRPLELFQRVQDLGQSSRLSIDGDGQDCYLAVPERVNVALRLPDNGSDLGRHVYLDNRYTVSVSLADVTCTAQVHDQRSDNVSLWVPDSMSGE